MTNLPITIDHDTHEEVHVDPKAIFLGKKPEEIFAMYGGEMYRGAISRCMRDMISVGFTTGQIAKMLNKRYQHVRNVMKEPLKRS